MPDESFYIKHPIIVKKGEGGNIYFIDIQTEMDDDWYKDLGNGTTLCVNGRLPEPDDDIVVQIAIHKKIKKEE